MSHRSMTRDSTNSQGLILRVYPTIKHTITKSSYFLCLSLFTMGDGLLRSSGVATLTGAAASSNSFSLGQEDSLLHGHILPHMTWCSQFEKCFRDTASIMGLLPFHNSPFSIICYFFIIVLLKWFRLVLCRPEVPTSWHATEWDLPQKGVR